jgi:Flp pilus assembly pilin Flp
VSSRRRPAEAFGQGLVEYGLILGLGALLAVVILVFFGGTVAAALDFVGRLVDEATRGA